MRGMVDERPARHQTGMYAWMVWSRGGRTKKKPGPETGLASGCGDVCAARLDQRCAAMLRACVAALFSAATGGTLPSKASLSCWFNTGSMRS